MMRLRASCGFMVISYWGWPSRALSRWFTVFGSISPIQEIFQQFMAVFAENGFGVELHAFDGQSFVAHAHDRAIFRPRGNFQAIRKTLALNDQGMITRHCRR